MAQRVGRKSPATSACTLPPWLRPLDNANLRYWLKKREGSNPQSRKSIKINRSGRFLVALSKFD